MVPLVFELIFVFVLSYLLYQAEHELKNEILSNKIMYSAGNLGQNVVQGGMAVAGYASSGSEYLKDSYENSKIAMNRRIKELEVLIKQANKEAQLKRLSTFKRNLAEGTGLMDKILHASEQKMSGGHMDFVFSGPLALARSKRLIDKLQRDLQLIRGDESTYAKEYTKASAKTRSLVQYWLMGFIGLNVGVAIFLAQFFTKSVTQRLDAVIENTRRVPKGEELTPVVSGGDEIAEMDQAFHDMVNELYTAQKMKQYLLSMVSHDLRSPLTSVQGLLTLLEAGVMGDLSEKGKQRVKSAERELDRLIRMTNDLLDVERLASGNLEMYKKSILAFEILDATIASMQTFAEQHGVTLNGLAQKLTLEADKERLVQVMVNLVSNAVKYSPRDSIVSLSVQKRDSDALFKVKDHGRGIPPEFQSKIFEKFQQVEEADSKEKGGKGLGLAICSSIVEAHDGEIGVESAPGEGSTFWFSIPLSCGDSDEESGSDDDSSSEVWKSDSRKIVKEPT